MDYSPPSYNSPTFNTSLFLSDGGGYLTLTEGDARYLRLAGGTVRGYTLFNGGIDSSSYSLSGISINFSTITGVSAGTATANKALILDGSKQISTLNAITSNTYYGTTANIQFMNCDILTAAVNFNAPTFYAAGTAFINSTLDMSNINTISFAGTKRIQDVQTIDFNLSSLAYKSILRKSTISGNDGLEIYDTQFSGASHAMLSFIAASAVNNYTSLKLYSPYNLPDTAGTAYGQSFQFQYRNGPSFGGGLAISTTATSAGTYSEQDRINLSVDGGAKPYIVLNPKFSQLHLFPQGLAELNTSYSENVVVGEEMRIRKYLKVDSYIQVGTSTDTTRLISALNSGMGTGTSAYFTLGRDASIKNQAEISFYYDSTGSNSNRIDFGFFGGALMYLTAQGRLGVGTSSPRAPLEVSATTGQINIISISTITYGYNVSNNVWTNYGGGPITIPSLSGIFNGNIYVSQNVFTTSDRRLKQNIKEIDLDIENYKKLKPVSYNYKCDKRQQIGFIAQDVLKVCAEAITFTENENMEVEEVGDLKGIQLGMDYKTITVLNTNIIQKLIKRVELLENELKNIKSNI